MKLYYDLAEYYFSIEGAHRDIKHDINYITSFLKRKISPTLLDLGCGTGEHLGILAQSGITCTGIDSSHKMLEIARKRFGSSINFTMSDIVNFDFYEEFDMVTCLFGTFDYLLDDEGVDKAFLNTWLAMKPNGIAIFEIWNSAPVKRIQKKEMSKVSRTKYQSAVIDRERGFNLIPDPKRTLVQVDYRYVINDLMRLERLEDSHTMRAFSVEELRPFIETNGLQIGLIHANFTKEPFSERSNRFVLQLVKE